MLFVHLTSQYGLAFRLHLSKKGRVGEFIRKPNPRRLRVFKTTNPHPFSGLPHIQRHEMRNMRLTTRQHWQTYGLSKHKFARTRYRPCRARARHSAGAYSPIRSRTNAYWRNFLILFEIKRSFSPKQSLGGASSPVIRAPSAKRRI